MIALQACPKQDGAGIAAGPAVVVYRCLRSFRFLGYPRSQFEQEPGRCDASPRTPNAFRTVGYCCIVMLVASSPTVWFQPAWDKSLARRPSRSLRLSPWSVCQCPKAIRTGKAPTPTMGAGDGSRQAVGRGPRTRSVRLAVPTDRCTPSGPHFLRDCSLWKASLPCLPELSSVLPKQAFRRSFRAAAIRPTAARHSLHLRFARFVPKNSRGAFSDAAAGIAAASFRSNFSNSFRGLFLPERGSSSLPMDRGCARRPSRASIFCDSYPQLAAMPVDSAG